MVTFMQHLLPQSTSPWSILIVKATLTLIVTVLLGVSLYYLFRKTMFRLHKQGDSWPYVTVKAISKPLIYLITLIGVCLAVNVFISTSLDMTLDKYVPKILQCGIIIFMTWVAINFINGIQTHSIHQQKQNRLDKTTIYALTKLGRIVVIILAILFILPIFGIGISGLVAFGSVGGAAFAFASKDLLANFFGGIIVYFDKPFAIGDWIRSPDRNIEGIVEYIGWRSCRIRTFDLRPLYVPNSLFTTISIENVSRMTHRRINTTVGVRYDDASKIKAIADSIRLMLQTHEAIDNTQTIMVNLVNFGSSSLDIQVYAYTKTTKSVEFQNIQQEIYLQIIDVISQHGAQCAFPTTTLDLPENILGSLRAKQSNPDVIECAQKHDV